MGTGTKLAVGVVVIVGVTIYMAYIGASTSWKYYLTADECAANGAALVGDRIRVSGTVAPNTLHITADRTEAAFSLEGKDGKVNVVCTGPLPDNLAEGIDVVVEGRLETAGVLRGDKLLTRCASKYESEKSEATSRRARPEDGP